MPLQKRHPRGESPQHQLSSTRQQLPERRRTLHTISELSATEAPTPNFSSFIGGLQRQPLDQTYHSKAMPDVAKASNRRSLPQHVPNPQYPQVKANHKAPLASAQHTYQTPVYRSLHDSNMGNDELRWTVKRAKARSQRKSAATVQEYTRQLLQNLIQDSSYPAIPRKVVDSTSRSSLRSCSSHQHLLINSHSLSELSSSSLSSGNLDRRPNLGALGSYPEAWSYKPRSAERSISDITEHPTLRNIAIRRSKSGSSSNSSSIPTAPPPIPVALLASMQPYSPTPPQHLGSGARSITTNLIRPISTTRISLPSTLIDQAGLSQQDQRKTFSRAAQQQHESDVQRARLESLAALTAVHPGSYRHRHAPPLNLNELRQPSVFPSQHHRASLQHCLHSNRNFRPPSQYDPLLSSTFNETAPQHHISHSSEHRTVPRRESLTQWNSEREEARTVPDSMRRADMKAEVRRADEVESDSEQELMKIGKKGGEKGVQNERGCLAGVLRLVRVRL
ncbi:hypothetical protein B0T12DRAFT_424697 [Alternaria alternata]|jgi:hypothetical protein|nr:hypothetical protein B0T12DRAFT_424697 [Alternaria alternata]